MDKFDFYMIDKLSIAAYAFTHRILISRPIIIEENIHNDKHSVREDVLATLDNQYTPYVNQMEMINLKNQCLVNKNVISRRLIIIIIKSLSLSLSLSIYLSIYLSIALINSSWQVLLTASGVRIELIYVSLCWLANTDAILM